MDLSVIWLWAESAEANKKTAENLVAERQNDKDRTQILIYRKAESAELPTITGNVVVEVIPGFEDKADVECYADAVKRFKGEYVTMLYGGDTWGTGTIDAVRKYRGTRRIVTVKKFMPNGSEAPFGKQSSQNPTDTVWMDTVYDCYPISFGGTFLRRNLFAEAKFQPKLGIEAERKFFLDILMKVNAVQCVNGGSYYGCREVEGEQTFFPPIYQKEYYRESFTDFWLPYLKSIQKKNGSVPPFVQLNLLFSIAQRILANQNNKNKHVIEDGEELEFINNVHEALQYVDDLYLFNGRKLKWYTLPDSMKWIMGVLKYGEDYRFSKYYMGGNASYGAGETVFNKLYTLNTNVAFMDYREGCLEIDGTVHPILFSMADEVCLMMHGEKYPLKYNERYAHTKAFGVSMFKSHSFHVSIPLAKLHDGILQCYAFFGKEPVKIDFCYKSHFSRLSGRFKNSYWYFGDEEQMFLMTRQSGGMQIVRATEKEQKKKERALSVEMLKAPGNRKKNLLFWGIRRLYFMAKHFKKKPIWMYLDKIYKGGDSSEYLYKYASAQDNDFKHYYLVDKNATDFARLKKEGYKPLVRGTIKHRLIFLLSDMMVISNSTVCVFNGFDMVNSSYVRDLINFHVCCVQHGMSVQKIAVAQNRLRDNIRLYFCASKYELKNLYHPIYDYQGYEALKLTGVPRYDGLKNDDQKQIMISPTWRMQAAVPVRTSESEQRDYNPMFKESDYYKVFNSLINDPRLIEAAKQYGYRIKYVLHPIVSSQVEDFDKNDYVDIVPAVGDMSYEKMFCESSLMVTDFSGIQFDFAYMRKPLVYLHHKDIPQHYEEGSFFYDTMAFGEICHDNDELIDTLIEYMSTGCQMKPEYVSRADDFFYYDDDKNCERIYREMIRYQNKYIFHIPEEEIPYTAAEGGNYVLDAREREALTDEFKKILKDNEMPVGKLNPTDLAINGEIDEKAVMVLGLGKGVRGNMQYILNELNSSDEYEGYTVYVRGSEETEEAIRAYIQNNGWDRTRIVTSNKEYDRLLETVKYLVTEVYFPDGWVKRPGQVSINIWHGTPLKKLGLAKNSNNLHKDGNTQKNFIDAEYLLYPNHYTREHMLASYKVSELMEGKAAMIGYPRTGGMMAAAESDLTDVKKKLAPNGEKIFAYMPTWKDYLKVEQVVEESRVLLNYLDSHLQEDQILYVNLHHKVSDSLDYSVFKKIRKFPADVDSYVLLAASEALITDYSSVFYDYLALRRQIILYCHDYKLYRTKRGTYMDLMSLPFDKAVTPAEVMDALNRGKTYDDAEAFKTFCEFDSVDNARRLVGLFKDHTEGIDIQDIPRGDKKQILVFSERCQDSDMTDRLREAAAEYPKDRMKLYIANEMFAVDQNKPSAYPMLSENATFGTVRDRRLSGMGKSVLAVYENGGMTLEKAMEYLRADYCIANKRDFGRAKFDQAVIYDVADPQLILSLAMMETDKYLVVTGEMLSMIEGGDRFMKDTVEYVLPYMKGVFVADLDDELRLEVDLGRKIPVQIMRNAKDLIRVFEL